jgi:hypothetical protein
VIAAKVEDLGWRLHRLAGRKPNADPRGLRPAKYRSGEQGVQRRPLCSSWGTSRSESNAAYPILIPYSMPSSKLLHVYVEFTPI